MSELLSSTRHMVQQHHPSHKCRICFENGGDIIAPCNCNGTSRWVHRECLDEWRAASASSHAFRECGVCKCPYHLKHEESTDYELVRQIIRKLATQTCKWFLFVQLVIIVLAMLVRACDVNEELVTKWDFKQERGHQTNHGFFHAMRYHDGTYYLAGLIAFATIIGVPFTLYMVLVVFRDIRADGTRCIYTNNTWCIFCLCPTTCPGANAAALAIAGIVFFSTVGFSMLAGLLIAALQYLVRDFAAQYEREAIVRAYVVQDLARPEEYSEPTDDDIEAERAARQAKLAAEVPADLALVAEASVEQEKLQRDITREFNELTGEEQLPAVGNLDGGVDPSQRGSYGSMGNSAV